MSTNLNDASKQWSSRPADQRFTSLTDLLAYKENVTRASAASVVGLRLLTAAPVAGDDHGLVIVGPGGNPVAPTNWAFGQLARLSSAPAAYLRSLPSPLAADCLNYSIANNASEDVGVLLRREDGVAQLAAVTGAGYGRVWDRDIVKALIRQFGDGVTGHFRVPGEFGERVEVTKENTTIYASDRDLFVFLADEDRRIEIPGRRAERFGLFARGFFVWNSEVGKTTFGVRSFVYDYTCKNRIVWGAEDVREFRIRHTSQAPDRWLREVAPALEAYAQSSDASLIATIEAARSKKIGDAEDVQKFLQTRFTRTQAAAISAVHLAEEGRPIETLWDATTGITAYARNVPFQDERVELETAGGEILKLAA